MMRLCWEWLRLLPERRRARLRELDVKLLWPEMLKAADGDPNRAALAFAVHAAADPAWEAQR